MVLVCPMLRRAAERWPGCEIFFLTFRENCEALGLLGMVPEQNVFTIDTGGFFRFLSSTVAVLIRLRRVRLDASVDLEFFSRFSAILSFLSGARARVGFHRFHAEGLYRGDLLTHRVAYNPYLHTVKSFLSLVEALALDPNETPMVKVNLGGLPLPLPRFRHDAQVEKRVLEKLQLLRRENPQQCGEHIRDCQESRSASHH
jgi:ADP-heptose:LPS heptosyltransferase